MKRKATIIVCMLVLALNVWAGYSPKEHLKALFTRAEQCYLTDDYEQLKDCVDKYVKIYNQSENILADSTDVFYGYYCKMMGAYYYGMTENAGYSSHLSEYYYKNSINVFSKRNSDDNINKLHEELAQLYYKIKNYDAAKKQLESVFAYYDNHFNILGIESCEEPYYKTLSQLAMCSARLRHFEQALQQIDEAQKYFKKKKSEFYYETLRREGKILMMQADSLGDECYNEARKCYERYVNEEYASIAHRLDTMSSSHRAQHWLATHRFLYDCYRLGNHAPEMLYNLALFSKGYLLAYENNRQTPQVKWDQVRRKLTDKDCAIEFVQYFGRNDEKRMGCLVLHKNSRPKFIDLFDTDSLLSQKLTSYYTVGDAFDAADPEIKDTLYQDSRLQGLIWSPQLMSAIGKAENVYFAPDGLIHQWAIEYLIPDSQKTCYRLSSTRNLTLRRSVPKLQNAMFCGGISFRALYLPTEKDNDYMAYRYLKPLVQNIINLPNSKIEVDSIYACRNNPNDTLLVGAYATDSRIMGILNKNHYDIIHISTHGHYIGNIDIYNDLRPLADDLSLSRCGLIFAGAAHTLSDDDFDDSHYDAVISGAELASLNLSKTELLVFNACQTGQGRLTDDGIYGLQRAAKQAGANAMMVSLWNLYDYSSGIFLRFFYEEIEKQDSDRKDIHAAFLAARKRLMEHDVKIWTLDEATFGLKCIKQTYQAPRYVNPFIIIDAF